MANMGHCRFQNTAQDLRDCLDHFHDDDLSHAENDARLRLIKYAQRIIEEAQYAGFLDEDEEG